MGSTFRNLPAVLYAYCNDVASGSLTEGISHVLTAEVAKGSDLETPPRSRKGR